MKPSDLRVMVRLRDRYGLSIGTDLPVETCLDEAAAGFAAERLELLARIPEHQPITCWLVLALFEWRGEAPRSPGRLPGWVWIAEWREPEPEEKTCTEQKSD